MDKYSDKLKGAPKSRVHLHVHLDGSFRPETIWELLTKKNLNKPGDGSLSDLKEALVVKQPKDLQHFLKGFEYILPAVQGDLTAIERVSKEFVQDQSRDHVAYCETRFSPHLLLQSTPVQPNGASNVEPVTVDDVVSAVLKGISEGEDNCPGTKVKVILSCMRGLPLNLHWEVLRLCEEFKDRGVVAIDIAGMMQEEGDDKTEDYAEGANVFQAAQQKGIHRTVHAGEDAGAESVKTAMEELKAERIGHGYRVIEDEEIYQKCRDSKMHFEVCPHSSYATGSISHLKTTSKQHPVVKFAEDNVSFSISTDDPLITDTTLTDEYNLMREFGLTEAHLTRANMNAALHSFLPPDEKLSLINQVKEAYGVVEFTPPVVPPTSNGTPTIPTKAAIFAKPNIQLNTWENRT